MELHHRKIVIVFISQKFGGEAIPMGGGAIAPPPMVATALLVSDLSALLVAHWIFYSITNVKYLAPDMSVIYRHMLLIFLIHFLLKIL